MQLKFYMNSTVQKDNFTNYFYLNVLISQLLNIVCKTSSIILT